jgi:hypothetical protein
MGVYDKLYGRLEKAESFVLNRQSLISNPNYMNAILARAANAIKPMVRALVIANFQATGIGTKSERYKSTGYMRKAVEGTRVYLKIKNGDLRLKIYLSPNLTPYDGQKLDAAGFYRAFASLNYGAVHGTGGVLGKRSKVTLKKQAAGEAINAGSSSQMLAGRKVALRRLAQKLIAARNISGKDVSVRKAYSFFRITPGQLSEVKVIALRIINDELKKSLSSQANRKVA